jgi:hypothetical protein
MLKEQRVLRPQLPCNFGSNLTLLKYQAQATVAYTVMANVTLSVLYLFGKCSALQRVETVLLSVIDNDKI